MLELRVAQQTPTSPRRRRHRSWQGFDSQSLPGPGCKSREQHKPGGTPKTHPAKQTYGRQRVGHNEAVVPLQRWRPTKLMVSGFEAVATNPYAGRAPRVVSPSVSPP